MMPLVYNMTFVNKDLQNVLQLPFTGKYSLHNDISTCGQWFEIEMEYIEE